MRKLALNNPSYEHLVRAFREWLDVLGYNTSSVYNLPNIAREFFHFLEQRQGRSHIRQMQPIDYKKYVHHISSRANQRRGGGLSNRYVNQHIHTLHKLIEFLSHKGAQNIPALSVRQLKLNIREITCLTTEEINQLYATAEKGLQESQTMKYQALYARDKAMLTVYYSCGLRKNEGLHLELNDINLDTRIVHVRKGKNYKERLVPLSKASAKYLQDYIYDYRPVLLRGTPQDRLFIGYTGKPMKGQALYRRFKLLVLATDDPVMQQKELGLHSLRHSIATHLLQAGMELKKIQRFLGHSSLESTQIYTHLLESGGQAHYVNQSLDQRLT